MSVIEKGRVGWLCMRIASVVAPLSLGFVLPRFGISAVSGYFTLASVAGGVVCFTAGAVEGADRRFGDISP